MNEPFWVSLALAGELSLLGGGREALAGRGRRPVGRTAFTVFAYRRLSTKGPVGWHDAWSGSDGRDGPTRACPAMVVRWVT